MFLDTAFCSDVNGFVVPLSSDTVVPAGLPPAAAAGAGAAALAVEGAATVVGAAGEGAAPPLPVGKQ